MISLFSPDHWANSKDPKRESLVPPLSAPLVHQCNLPAASRIGYWEVIQKAEKVHQHEC